MFFKKAEQKRSHPLLTMAIAAMTAVGVCSVVNMSKKKMKKMMGCLRNLCGCKKQEDAAGALSAEN